MKTWLKGGLIGLGIFVIGFISLFINNSFFDGATTIFYYIYKIIFFMSYLFRFLLGTGVKGEIFGVFLGIIISPIFYFIIGAIIGLIISKIKEKKK